MVVPPPSEKKKAQLSFQQRERLLRITGRSAKGPFGAKRNPRDQSREGVGLPSAKVQPNVDLWSQVDKDVQFVEGLEEGDPKDYLPSLVLKPKFKASLSYLGTPLWLELIVTFFLSPRKRTLY